MLSAAAAEQPIVVFFDQFEEYFLYLAREDREQADRFIADLAELYDDRKSKVHVVLSMREDFYVELDEFRDRIPTIFHNDSSLRLQWFDPKQARAVIEGPARAARVAIDPALLDRLVADLSLRHGRVEPAQLQIVCDTLWGKRSDDGLTLGAYLALGQSDGETTVAEQIVSDRLTEEFRSYDSRSDLELIERLLEPRVLSTERGTKYARDVPSLVHLLSEDRTPPIKEEDLMHLLRRLAASRLVRLQIRDDLPHVELTHDYLVADPKRLDELRRTVRNIWPLRTLAAGLREWKEDEGRFSGDTTDLESVLERAVTEWETTQHDGKPPTDRLPLTPDHTLLFLHLALQRGVHARAAFEIAVAHDVPALGVVLETMRGQHLDHAAYAVRLLGELRTSEAVEALHEALELPHLASEAQEQVTAIARSAAPVAEAAAQVLVEYLESLLALEELAPFALEDLGRLEHPAAVESLRKRLDDPRLADEATDALRRLTRSYNLEVAELAEAALAASTVPLAPAVAPPPPRLAPGPSRPRPSGSRRASVGSTRRTSRRSRGRSSSSASSSSSAPARASRARGQAAHRPTRRRRASTPRGCSTTNSACPSRPGRAWPRSPMRSRRSSAPGRSTGHCAPCTRVTSRRNSVHRFVAGLPGLLRTRVEAPGQLVVTSAFDETLERWFDEQKEPYSVVHYLADRTQAAGSRSEASATGPDAPRRTWRRRRDGARARQRHPQDQWQRGSDRTRAGQLPRHTRRFRGLPRQARRGGRAFGPTRSEVAAQPHPLPGVRTRRLDRTRRP